MNNKYTLKRALLDINKKYKNTSYASNLYIMEVPETYNYEINNIKEFSLPFDEMTIIGKTIDNISVFKLKQIDPETITVISKLFDKDMFEYTYTYTDDLGIHMDAKQLEKVMGMYATDQHIRGLGNTIIAIFSGLTKMLSEKDTYKAKFKRTPKMMSGGYRFLDITYVSKKKQLPKDIQGFTMGRVNWSHSFSVCGHWRRTKGIGKDRQGVRCVDKYTWVVPHEKITHLNKVNKLRVVK